MPKNEETSSAALKALLDKEFGPPKFAIQKQSTSPRKGSIPTALSTDNDSVCLDDVVITDAAGSCQPPERPWMTLSVVEGPAKGNVFRADDQTEVRDMGRTDRKRALSHLL